MEWLKQTFVSHLTGKSKTTSAPVYHSREILKKTLIRQGMDSKTAMLLKQEGRVRLDGADGSMTYELVDTKPEESNGLQKTDERSESTRLDPAPDTGPAA